MRATCRSTPQDPTAIAANSVSETSRQQITIGEILATLAGGAQQRAMYPLQPTVLATVTGTDPPGAPRPGADVVMGELASPPVPMPGHSGGATTADAAASTAASDADLPFEWARVDTSETFPSSVTADPMPLPRCPMPSPHQQHHGMLPGALLLPAQGDAGRRDNVGGG